MAQSSVSKSFFLRHLLATPSDLEPSSRKLLLLLGAAFFIGQYDMTLLSLALPDVQASFGVADENLGKMIAFARIGALPAFALALLADRIGRRRLLIVTLVGLSVFSLASGLAQTANQFMLLQSGARLFTTLEEVLAVVYALEMLPSRYRGWGVGFLAAMGGLGSGLASLLYGTIDFMPGGWRALYVIGGLAILYVAWLRRDLKESAMFANRTASDPRRPFLQPFEELVREHRQTLLVLITIASFFWFQVGAGLNFMSKFLQDVHGYSTAQVSTLYIFAGIFAIFGNVLAGRASDSIGRRPTLAFGIVLNFAAFLLFYNTSGWVIPIAWVAAIFGFFVVDVMVNAMSGELFPTSCRSTAATVRTIISVAAGAVGLFVEGVLYSWLGGHGEALSLMTFSSLMALPVVALLMRETAQQDLA